MVRSVGLSVELGPVEWSWEVLVGFQNQGFGVIIVYRAQISPLIVNRTQNVFYTKYLSKQQRDG